jgi:hypothetical protein
VFTHGCYGDFGSYYFEPDLVYVKYDNNAQWSEVGAHFGVDGLIKQIESKETVDNILIEVVVYC